MFTDVKGFTSKTSLSSRKQLHRMLELHEQLITPIFKKFRGRIIKTIGDAFMVTFHSPTDAVLCGIEIQKRLAKHNEEVEDNDQLEIRIAINSGEVTLKGNDVFGEAVNIASRLEGIAEAGDIYFTESVYLAMNKSEIPTAEVGYRHFKGIPEEIKVYKVIPEWGKKRGFFGKEKQIIRGGRKKWTFWRILKWAAIILLILIVLGKIAENTKQKQQTTQEQISKVVNGIKTAYENNNPRAVRQGIDQLMQMREGIKGSAPELDKLIQELETQYQQVYGNTRLRNK